MINQRQEIKAWLESGRPLTALMAVQLFGCIHLSRVIGFLRKQGMDIKTKTFREGRHCYVEYSL